MYTTSDLICSHKSGNYRNTSYCWTMESFCTLKPRKRIWSDVLYSMSTFRMFHILFCLVWAFVQCYSCGCGYICGGCGCVGPWLCVCCCYCVQCVFVCFVYIRGFILIVCAFFSGSLTCSLQIASRRTTELWVLSGLEFGFELIRASD